MVRSRVLGFRAFGFRFLHGRHLCTGAHAAARRASDSDAWVGLGDEMNPERV